MISSTSRALWIRPRPLSLEEQAGLLRRLAVMLDYVKEADRQGVQLMIKKLKEHF